MSGDVRSFSNHAEVDAWLLEGVASFGFNSPAAGGKTLGEALVDNHVVKIRERSLDEQRGAGAPWPSNDPDYAVEKERDFGSTKVNVRTGAMLEEEAVRGYSNITDDVLEHGYGTGQPGDPEQNRRPRTGRGGRPSKAKTRPEPTDIAKAQWAEEQGRGFFELDDEIKDSNNEIAGDSLADHLRSR